MLFMFPAIIGRFIPRYIIKNNIDNAIGEGIAHRDVLIFRIVDLALLVREI